MTRLVRVVGRILGGCLWGALFPAVTWAHHGFPSTQEGPGLFWLLLPLLAFGVALVAFWCVLTLLEKRQKPRAPQHLKCGGEGAGRE
jgi:hypothetical protein